LEESGKAHRVKNRSSNQEPCLEMLQEMGEAIPK